MIRAIRNGDAKHLCEIYNYYIKNTIITFEEQPVDEAEIKNRIEKITTKYPWLVYEEDGKVFGYAYATEWKTRSAYKNSVEVAVYLDINSQGKGIGSMLYKELIDRLKNMNFHSFVGGIALPNPASVALHEKFGFQKVAHFKEIGYKFEKWIDVGYWQLIIS